MNPDETPTVEIDVEPVHSMETIDAELELWRARFVLARNGAGKYTLPNCTAALNRWLDMRSDAMLEERMR
jgi:hypothetical protein